MDLTDILRRPASTAALTCWRQAGLDGLHVAGAGPVGLAAAAPPPNSSVPLWIMIGDLNEARLSHARNVGFVPIDLSRHDRLGEQIAAVVGEPTVDLVVDAVGFSQGPWRRRPARHCSEPGNGDHPAGWRHRHTGIVCHRRPAALDQAAKTGNLSLRLGLGWSKSNSFHTEQTPVLRYNRQLMMALLEQSSADRQDRQCYRNQPGRCAEGLRRIRQGHRRQIRARPARRVGEGGLTVPGQE